MTHIGIRLCATLLLVSYILPALAQKTSTATAIAVVPPLVKFSGVVTDPAGKPLTGIVGVTFLLYKESQGGAPLWMETQNVTTDRTGHYTLMLGSSKSTGLPADVFVSGEARWLGVQPEGQAEQPRVLLLSVPYALKAADAETLGGKPASAYLLNPKQSEQAPVSTHSSSTAASKLSNTNKDAIVPSVAGGGTTSYIPRWTSSTNLGNSVIFQNTAGNLGIGASAPAYTLDISKPTGIRVSATGTATQALYGISTATTGSSVAVLGEAHSSGAFGGLFRNTANGTILKASNGTNTIFNVSGNGAWVSDGTCTPGPLDSALGVCSLGASSPLAVRAMASAAGGIGVYGISSATTGTGKGVIGEAHSLSGIGGLFTNTVVGGKILSATVGQIELFNVSSGGVAVGSSYFGPLVPDAPLTVTGDLSGVSGILHVTAAGGIAIHAASGDGEGIIAEGANGFPGVVGSSSGPSAVGVQGIGGNAGGIGVQGFQGSGQYAGDFEGNVNVNGTLTKTAGSFRIDHPMDPANKYLSHSFVESPDMMNIYNGNVVLDVKGEAWVSLPAWFEALNRDFRYQLTCIGGFAPVYVAEKISGNRFKIAGGKPALEISWQITGIRQDAYAKAHPIVVEQQKPPQEQGLYIFPEGFGQPQSKGLAERYRSQSARLRKLMHTKNEVAPKTRTR
jgi:trimeric autotransporter adhesin